MDSSADTQNAKRFRSPPYPFIPLSKAVERARAVYDVAKHHEVSFPVLADAWDYGLKSSGLVQTAAALIHFGLMSDQGTGKNRKFSLTNDALRIIQDADPQSSKRRDALKRAALKPKIHGELWKKFGALSGVSDFVLINYLTLDRRDEGEAPFSPSAAEELVSEYKATMDYAGVTVFDNIPLHSEDKADNRSSSDGGEMQHQTPEGQGQNDRVPPPPVGEASLVMYDNRIRITADVDVEGAKELIQKLKKRIDLLEEEQSGRTQ